MHQVRKKLGDGLVFGVMLGALSSFSGNASAAVLCQLHLGAGCNGPVVYEYQLCAVITFNQGKCERLCGQNQPICKASDFDSWVAAYEAKGRHGTHGPLAETSAADTFDQTGQLAATSGNTYTNCMRFKTSILAGWSGSVPVSPPVTCPKSIVASDTTCTAGTIFNGDPTNPKCITKDSYCSGGGSSGNFVATMNAGFQMVAVQNEHFVNAPSEDNNLQLQAATAGSDLPGLTAPLKPSLGGGLNAQAITSSIPSTRGFSAPTANFAGNAAALSADSPSLAPAPATAPAEPSAFAAKNFATDGAEYRKGSESALVQAGNSVASNGVGSSSGVSWFGAGTGGGAAAVAGSASGDIGFKDKDGASRGLASVEGGRLKVEDPVNYFLMSDVDLSLFKRVTAQCRKKERSLVLAP